MAASKQEVKVEIDMKTGEIRGDVVCGPGGVACESMLKEVFKGLDFESAGKTPEFYQHRQTVGTVKKS